MTQAERNKKYKDNLPLETKQKRWKVYYSKPGVKEARKIYAAKRWKNPEIREKMLSRRDHKKYLIYMREYSMRPEVRLKRIGNQLMHHYGISIIEYDALYKKQKGFCAICPKKLPEGFSKNKHVDHDHKKGIVRGLLCSSCNLLLGHAKDNPEILIKASKYLKKYI